MSLLRTIETISKLPSVKFCIPATNQHQHIRIAQNKTSKAVFGSRQIEEKGASIEQLVSRSQVETQIRPYHVMTGVQAYDIPNSQGYNLPVRSTVPGFMSKQSQGSRDKCRKKQSNPCKQQTCKLKKPKKKKANECDPDEPEDICKKDQPCNWYPGKRPC